MEEKKGLLAGMKVLDLSRVLAAPYCGMLLADMGADVIKIERPGKGDDARGNFPIVNGESGYFINLNRNKRGMVLNLKAKEGREIFLKMVEKADVVLENYRPGVMDRLGLGYEELKRSIRASSSLPFRDSARPRLTGSGPVTISSARP